MPGRSSTSGPLRLVGALVAVIAVVGYVVADWRFDASADGALPTGIALACVAIAVGWTAYRRFA